MIDDRFPHIEQAEYYLDRMFGDRKGFVAMAFGHNPRTTKPRFAAQDFRSKYYSWPDEKDRLLEEVDDLVNSPETRGENVEVFINPALRKTPSRKAGSAAPIMWVWADMDHSPTEQEMDRVNALGALSVLSGTEGHRHIYIPLDKPVTSSTHQALCRALRDALGADSKIADNDLLRLPGTLNWKTTQPKTVFLKSGGRTPRDNKALVRLLTDMTSKSWDDYKKDVISQSADVNDVPEDRKAPSLNKLPKLVREAFRYTPDPGARNQAIFKLIATCKEEGVSREDTHALVRTYPPALSKWGSSWRISNDVDRIWQKCKGLDTAVIIDESDDGTDQPNLIFHPLRTLLQRVKMAPPPSYLFDGIIVQGDYGIISAEDKAGKSFIMMDAALSAASGTPWMDRYETVTSGPVIACVGEGSERKQSRRIYAIGRHKGLSDAEIEALPIHLLLGVPQVKDEGHIEELEKAIRDTKAVLVLIDPFYLAASGVDFAKLADVGSALQPIQAVCQRYGAALLLSHHWNKTGTGNGHNRTSGVGLTAWGRFLISVAITKESTDHTTKKTTVLQEWSIKGDEVMTDNFAVEREVWADDPSDLTSDMNYRLRTPSADEVKKASPMKYEATAEKISMVLEENLDGLGVNQIIKELKNGHSIRTASGKTIRIILDQLCDRGFIQEGKMEANRRVPYYSISPFRRTKQVRANLRPASVITLPADDVAGEDDV